MFGQLSDRVGRRRVLLGGLAGATLGPLLFALADSTAWLFVARAVQGISLGAVVGTAAAALVEAEPTGVRPHHAQPVGLGLVVGGIAALVAAFPTHSLALVLAGAALGGAGLGLTYFGSQTELNHIAPPERRGEVTAAYFTCQYACVSAAAVSVGLLSDAASLAAAVCDVGLVIAATAAVAAGWHLVSSRRGSLRA